MATSLSPPSSPELRSGQENETSYRINTQVILPKQTSYLSKSVQLQAVWPSSAGVLKTGKSTITLYINIHGFIPEPKNSYVHVCTCCQS